MRRSRSECSDLLTCVPNPARCVLRRHYDADASGLNRPEAFTITHNTMRRTEIRFLSRLLRQTMAGATEPRVFGRRRNGGDFCCVPGCSNQRGNDKVKGVKRSYYKFPLDQKRRNLWISAVKRADWVPRRWDFVCSDHFENGNLFFFSKRPHPFS